MEQQKKTYYKYCVVPMCGNNIKTAPDKVYFLMPKDRSMRKKWCEAMKKDSVSCLSCLYCCEDHFNIEEDTKNYMQYRIMALEHGQRVTLKLKKGVVPHVFQCQIMEQLQPPERKGAMKRKRQAVVEEGLTALTEADLTKAGPSKTSRSEANPRETFKSEADSDLRETIQSEGDSDETNARETSKSEADSDEDDADLRETIKYEVDLVDPDPGETIKYEIDSNITHLRETKKSEADSDQADYRETIKYEVVSDDPDPGETIKSEIDSDDANPRETFKSVVDIDEEVPSACSIPYKIDLKLNVSDNKIDGHSKKILQFDKAVQVNLKVHFRSKGVNVKLCKCK